MSIFKTQAYSDILDQFNQITDRPITIFLFKAKGIPLQERLQLLDVDLANQKSANGEGAIILLRYNKEIMVKNVDCHEQVQISNVRVKHNKKK
tara:strand:- start:1410 stop:1688 length:279 start_codon:yes stop_codon:yes gene_type:complete